MPAPGRTTVLHFAEASDTSGYFPQIARWHDRNRFRMIFGTLRRTDPRLEQAVTGHGVECFSLGAASRAVYPWSIARLAGLLRRARVDVIHTHLFDPSLVGLLAGAVARTPVRVLTRHYSNYHTRIDRRWHVRLDQLCTRLASRVFAVSQHTADHMVAEEAAPPPKVQVVWNGIDFDRVRISDPAAPARIRAELGGASTLIALVGRLHPEKGQTFLFKALPEVKRRASRPFLVLVAGEGPSEQSYREEVRRLGCDDVVRFLGFRSDISDLIAASDLLVLPSLAEAFGLVLTESLYLGTPVLATRVGGIAEIVEDGRDGVLIPPADSVAMASTLVDLINVPGRLASLRDAGRAKVAERFQFSAMVRAYESVYDELLTAARS